MKKREYYYAFVELEDGTCFYCTGSNLQRNFKTYEEAMAALEKQKANYSKKDKKRTYPDGTVEWLSYNDEHNLKYFIEKHYDSYERVFEDYQPKTKTELKKGKDEIFM